MSEICKNRRWKLHVTPTISYPNDHSNESLDARNHCLDDNPRDLPSDARLAAHLQRLCSQVSVTFIDTTDRLTAAASAGELVYPLMDTHLSPRGDQIVAEMLVPTRDKPEDQ